MTHWLKDREASTTEPGCWGWEPGQRLTGAGLHGVEHRGGEIGFAVSTAVLQRLGDILEN